MYIYKEKTNQIIKCAIEVHKNLGYGFFEKVYENSLIYELNKLDFSIETQKHINVIYKETIVGTYIADLVVDSNIIIEIKAVDHITSLHKLQLLNYLKATELKLGLVINFGNSRLQIKRVINDIKK